MILAVLIAASVPAPAGAVGLPTREVSSAAASAAGVPEYLSVPEDRDRDVVAAAVRAAQGSRTAREILRRTAASGAAKRVPIRLRPLQRVLGQYEYMQGVIELDHRYRRADPRQTAATLCHELLHVLQHRAGIPGEALEMELEAHILTVDMLRQLGLGDRMDEFSQAVVRELRKSPQAYVQWMSGQLPGKVRLIGQDFDDVESDLEDEADDLETPSAMRRGALTALRRRWAESDLALVESSAGKASYEAFARRVETLIVRRHRAWAGARSSKP